MSIMRLRILHLVLILMALPAIHAQEPRKAPRRVLILDSFGRNVSIFTVSIASFRAEVSRQWSGPLDLYEIPMEASRIGVSEGDKALADFLANRLAGNPLDLIVPFAPRRRDLLFRTAIASFRGRPC